MEQNEQNEKESFHCHSSGT